MFNVSVCFGGMVWAFRFKTQALAEDAVKALSEGLAAPERTVVTVGDDYGQQASFIASNISGFMFEDMSKSKEAHIDQLVRNAALQGEAQRRANSRPQSPSIVSPFKMGPGN